MSALPVRCDLGGVGETPVAAERHSYRLPHFGSDSRHSDGCQGDRVLLVTSARAGASGVRGRSATLWRMGKKRQSGSWASGSSMPSPHVAVAFPRT